MRETIHFLLGHETRTLSGVSPTLTVLDYLRGTARLCGTKEGCAEGDCGACTIVLGERNGRSVRYRAVNACILFVHALDGRQLLTVEHLAASDGTPHPVQTAFVEHHASQCGFCTPGFVMSAFALHHRGVASRAAVLEALAGNLCRCTGYRPIVDATLAACAEPPNDQFNAREAETADALAGLPTNQPLVLRSEEQTLFVPRDLPTLLELRRAHPHATLVAGGTDVGVWVAKQHRHLPVVIALERVAELARIDVTPEALSLGAAVPYQDALWRLGERWPDVGALLRRLGSVQIRNRGTIGGNVANGSPIGDTMPLLIALGAKLVLRSAEAEWTVPVEEFFIGYRRTALQPDEIVLRIDIPMPRPNERFAAYKVSKRLDQDISAVCAAFRVVLDAGVVRDIRIGFGGMAATPVRALQTEQALLGQLWTERSLEEATRTLAREFTPLTDMRGSAEYRSGVARNLLRKFFTETTSDETTRLEAAA